MGKKINFKRLFSHPEVECYGLNCDYRFWAEFNKEVLTRALISTERAIFSQMKVSAGLPPIDFPPFYNDVEREYAKHKINLLINAGVINKETYLYNKQGV